MGIGGEFVARYSADAAKLVVIRVALPQLLGVSCDGEVGLLEGGVGGGLDGEVEVGVGDC